MRINRGQSCLPARRLLRRIVPALLALAAAWTPCVAAPATAEPVFNLSDAVIVAAEAAPGPEQKAIQMLAEEVTKRTRLRWTRATSLTTNHASAIVIGN